MTDKERREHDELREFWAAQQITRKHILRCVELDRKATN